MSLSSFLHTVKCLFGFYSILIFVGYLMQNPFLYKWTVLFQTIQFSTNIVFVYAQLNVKTVLFQTIQFSVSTVSMSKNSYISSNSVQHKFSFVLFDLLIGPNQVVSLWPRVDLGVMAMKGYSTFSKAPACLVSYPGHLLVGSYLSAEMQLVYSTVSVNWPTQLNGLKYC